MGSVDSRGADAIAADERPASILAASVDAPGETPRLQPVPAPTRTSQVGVVLDGLYGMPLEAALQVCAPHARVVQIGHSAGATARRPAGALRGMQLTITGFAWLHTPLSDEQPALPWLWDALRAGRLEVEITALPLAGLPAAWRAQASPPHTKSVVLPGGAGSSGSASAA